MTATSTSGSFGRWLARKPVALAVVATLAAFGAYTSMYAFRKPFTAATFSGLKLAGYDLKVLLVVAQMVGYTLSKFTGVKVVSEAQPARRVGLIGGLIALAFLPLALLPFVPPPVQVACLLVNGLPLGMIWGLIFSFLEGRRMTEFLGLGLSVSFIFASGWTKTVGQLVMSRWGVTELAMPAVTGLLFVPLLALCLWSLAQLPPPDAADVADRSPRKPMDAAARRRFLRGFFLPIALLVLGYVLLTVYRDLRDTFMVEVLQELGQKVEPLVFARVETFAGLGVMLALGGLWFIRDHWRALGVYHVIIVAGAVVVGGATLLFQAGVLSPVWWLSLTGLGVYLGYVPFNSILFDRLLAATRQVGTAAFLISVADAAGYATTMVLYLVRLVWHDQISWARLTILMSFALALLCPLLLLASWLSLRRHRNAS